VIHLRLQDTRSLEESIKGMVDKSPTKKPPAAELVERARSKVADGEWTFWDCVTDAIDKLWEKRPRVEDADNRPILLLDLTKIILDPQSRPVPKSDGLDGDCWIVTIQGPDKSGNQVQVSVRLPIAEGSDELLEITSFMPLF
jgi:hypothetical protein